MECLAAAEADVLAFETIPSIKEAEALVELLKEFPNTKAWLALSCKVKVCCWAGVMVRLLISCAEGFPLFAGHEVIVWWQPVHRGGADCQQIEAADRRRGELLPARTGGAAVGLCQVRAEPRHKLGGLPQQWRGLGLRAGVSLPVEGENLFRLLFSFLKWSKLLFCIIFFQIWNFFSVFFHKKAGTHQRQPHLHRLKWAVRGWSKVQRW